MVVAEDALSAWQTGLAARSFKYLIKQVDF